jgi:lysophospholipase L1-like esterase
MFSRIAPVTNFTQGVVGVLPAANGGDYGAPGSMVVTSHNGLVNTLNSSSQTGRSYRVTHYTKQFLSNVRLVYANYGPVTATNAETGPGNPITVTAGLEYSGVTYQVLWNGQPSITIPNGGTAPPSDPVPLDIPTGSTFYERTCAAVTGGQSIGLDYYLRANLDSFTLGSDVTTATGAMATPDVSIPAQNAYTAVAILGTATPNVSPAVIILGDSIGAGIGDLVRSAADTSTNPGYPSRALGDNIPWVNFSTASCTLAQYNTASLTLQRRKLFSYFKYAIIELGTNDVQAGASLATVQASYIALANTFVNRGIKVYVCTQVPRVTSTDGMTSVTNQTPIASESIRTQVNTWLRTVPSPFAGVFDVAALIEVNSVGTLALNGGRWQVINVALVTSTSSGSNTVTTLNDTSQTWTVNQYIGIAVVITSGTGAGQTNVIVSNTATQLTVNSNWGTTPDGTSHYVIQDTPSLDGVHPNPTTAAILATGINTSVFI